MPKFIGVMMMGVAGIWHGMFGAHAPVDNNQQYGGLYGQNQNRPVNPNGSSMIGTVSSITGSTIVMQTIQRPNPTSTTTASIDFTVDATNARIIKSGSTTTASIESIKIGDRVIAQGTINGNSIVARLVIDTVQPEQIQKPTVKAPVKTPVKKPVKTTKPVIKK
ncbi:MAG: hypothetical protein WCV55_02685 [Candidatus Paceibacterota bacterium]